jgi:hypothetical protein
MTRPTADSLSNPEKQPTNPYLHAFRDIEYAASQEGLDAQGAYEIYEAHLLKHNLDPTIYLSMAITSGGFARDSELGIGEVIERNSEFGALARQALLHQHPELSEKDIVLPSDLGKVAGWSQADYLLFWFHTITGLTTDQARLVSDSMASSLHYPGFTDRTLDKNRKWSDYQQFTDDYVRHLRNLIPTEGRELEPNNIQAMLMILDGDISLGGRAEEKFCRAIGIPPQYQYLDKTTVEAVPGFSDSTRTLRGMGSSALGLDSNPAGLRFAGVGTGSVKTDIAFGLGFRKTSLSNALVAARFYSNEPETRPPRHNGHRPILCH